MTCAVSVSARGSGCFSGGGWLRVIRGAREGTWRTNQPGCLFFSPGVWLFPGCLAFSYCLPASHPQHQRLGFRVGSLEGEGRDRTEILTAWLTTFPFFLYILLLFYAGGSCRFFVLPQGRRQGWIVAICRSSAGLAPAGAAAWAGRMRPWGRDSRRSRVPGGCVWVRRKRQGGEEAPLLLALLQDRLVAGAGHQPMEGPNWGLSSAPLPWAAQAGAGFPTPRLPSSLSLFSFFLPHSHPVSPPPPPPYPRFVPAGVSRGQPGSRPFRTPDPHASLLSSNKKVPSAAPTQSRRPKPSKNRAKTISFSVPRAPAAARAERRGLRSARSG